MGNDVRLRGPWIIRGAGLDTSISSQSGSIPAGSAVALAMSPYSFMPDSLGRHLFTYMHYVARIAFVGSPDADNPRPTLYNSTGGAVNYASEWRHINP